MPTYTIQKDQYSLEDVSTFRETLQQLSVTKLVALANDSDIFSADEIYNVIQKLLAIPKDENPNLFIITEYTNALGNYDVDGALSPPDKVTDVTGWVNMLKLTPEAYIDAKMVSIRDVVAEAHHVMLHLLFNVINSEFGKVKV